MRGQRPAGAPGAFSPRNGSRRQPGGQRPAGAPGAFSPRNGSRRQPGGQRPAGAPGAFSPRNGSRRQPGGQRPAGAPGAFSPRNGSRRQPGGQRPAGAPGAFSPRRSLLTKSHQRPLKEEKAPRITMQAGCFAPAANGCDFGQSFPPRPRGRPSGRVPLEPPAFFNPSNGHPCPSPGGEHPCSPKKAETGKSAFGGTGRVDKDNNGVCQQPGGQRPAGAPGAVSPRNGSRRQPGGPGASLAGRATAWGKTKGETMTGFPF